MSASPLPNKKTFFQQFKLTLLAGWKFSTKKNKLVLNITMGIVIMLVAVYFFKKEIPELSQIQDTLNTANFFLILLGVVIGCIYIVLHGLMYTSGFKSIGEKVSLKDAVVLFLKRNFVSVFLPAGGVSSLAFFTTVIEEKGIEKNKIHFASTIYAVIGVLSVLIVSVPVLLYMFFANTANSNDIHVFIAFLLLVTGIVLLIYSIIKKGFAYKLVIKIYPPFVHTLEDIKMWDPRLGVIVRTLFYSVFIEFVCVFYLYIAMIALGLKPSFEAALSSYIISVLILNVSPFLRGLGAIELTITYILMRYGYSPVQAFSITILYRFFEFWLPMVVGLLSFIFTPRNIFLRIIPAVLIFVLGVVNIISTLTPAMHNRLVVLKDFLPLNAIRASNYLVLTSGLLLIATAIFLFKGLKNAWNIALFITFISFIGNLTKAIDYEEATLALFVALSLIVSRKAYFVRNNLEFQQTGIYVSIISIGAILIYGIIGFYFLDVTYFGIDFTFTQSISETIKHFFLVGDQSLHSTHNIANVFLYSINVTGFCSMLFLLYSLIRPFVFETSVTDEQKELAKLLVAKNGNSALDYFKTTSDKLFFFSADEQSFLSYRIAKNFAVVLEKPVCKDTLDFKNILIEFEKHCKKNNLSPCYYRVDAADLKTFKAAKKKAMLIGQEAIVDLTTFTLAGGDKKAMRNTINSIQQKNFKVIVHYPPIKDGLLQRMKSVSDEWLDETGYEEMIFSQGSFDIKELKKQTIITLESSGEKVIAFANIIPDYVKEEGTYDLIRKTKDAPGGALDFLLIELIRYFKKTGRKTLNIGMVPLSGIKEGKTIPEKTIRFAYEKLKQFSYYKNLREYKSKFDPKWVDKYLVYEDDYHLIGIPNALNKVMKP
ncbi:MAG: phosphatidylglycerol lysyltransferase domain-containing protein [Bacteroidia bacterium]